MSAADIIITVILVVLVALVIISMIRGRRKGKG